MNYCFDKLEYRGGRIFCAGWAAPMVPGLPVSISFVLPSGKELAAKVTPVRRPDVSMANYGNEEFPDYGFTAVISSQNEREIKNLKAKFSAGEGETADIREVPIDVTEQFERWKKEHSLLGTWKRYFAAKEEDRPYFWKTEKFDGYSKEDKDYNTWKVRSMPDARCLKEQRSARFPGDPLVSIVVPVYRPVYRHLRSMVDSVIAQTYTNWELCLAVAGENPEEVTGYLKSLPAGHRNIKVAFLPENYGIAGNTNKGIEMASGTFTAFADQDDLLRCDALFEYVRAAHLHGADVVYSDEDKVDDETGICFDPNFKPDYNPDLLCCNNYICHMLMVRRDLLDQAGLLDPRFDGAQDHELLLRLSELTNRFVHIPKVLYSWRVHSLSTSANPESKSAAYDAGAEAIKEHFARTGLTADVYPMANRGWYRSEFTLKEHPLVSIIIPNRDHSEDLARCVRSLQEVSTYQETEILIVENNSTDSAVFALYDELKKDERVKVITWDRPFNYSAINNFAAGQAKGEYLLLLNNDTEVITPDFLTSMMAYAMREDVGAVGARLLYPDGTVQHAGVLVGVSEGADHVFLKYADADPGYMGRSVVSQDMSAVTGACLLTKKELYLRLKGLDEEFTVAYNDVDYCLKLRDAGCFVVYDAFAKLTHYESKSRGYEDSEEKQARFEQEKQLLRKKWRKLSLGDPYYNINLSLKNGYYRLP